MKPFSRKLETEIESMLENTPYESAEELVAAGLTALREQLRLEELLAEGINSDVRIKADAAYFERKREEIRSRMAD